METNTLPRIAVIYATAQGSTREIAEFIAANLTARGATVEVADAEHAPDLSRFDAVILGSAVHNRALLPPLTDYIRAHPKELAARAVWLFSVGLGPALQGPIGRRTGRAVPKQIAAVRDSLNPREYRPFAGHYERAGVSLGARTLYRLLGGPRYGDLRDWPAISGWIDSIATELRLSSPKYIPAHP
ncbi:flavodoxin domain-containing protein [Nocardia sp. NBC_01503]|uniref:flavodoxin domain-containing protein n=1 Tax=Nocardia sp. NBC_01503 TaxID=2975997 RepID=UPI002E7C0C7F|nr:flavodoxin domain-containing protein [Nocardia sp. NBC_01503]WTL30640.1 flavodoxin domain-containing protein [Nocardia sp. NBC_01503]